MDENKNKKFDYDEEIRKIDDAFDKSDKKLAQQLEIEYDTDRILAATKEKSFKHGYFSGGEELQKIYKNMASIVNKIGNSISEEEFESLCEFLNGSQNNFYSLLKMLNAKLKIIKNIDS